MAITLNHEESHFNLAHSGAKPLPIKALRLSI
jgi:hypothetical protein